jgi:NADH-quinone oxidoreductase subunit J
VTFAGLPLLLVFVAIIHFVIEHVLPPSESVRFGAFTDGTAGAIGTKLFTAYLLPFEVTSVLILIAIVGAIVLARKEVD